jgi:type VI secretion system protein ImpH
MVFCIAGIGEEAIRRAACASPGGLLRYAPLLARRSKSAEGLEIVLSDFLGGAGVRVEPHVPRSVTIPPDQRARLGVSGCTLGEDLSAGDRIPDRAGKFRLFIGPLDRLTYLTLAPGGEARVAAAALVRLYLLDALEYDVVLGILAAEKPPFRLEEREDGPRLGIDTWFPGDSSADAWVGFPSCPAPPAGLDEERAA